MLLNLHVKNLALIDEAEVEFEKGLNILSGETGAGKSIILGSVNLALGGKMDTSVIGKHGESALVELTFSVDNNKIIESLQSLDIYPEDGTITITRRIMPGRSVIKINGETVTATLVKQVTAMLIDIHGQHDHQSLLYKSKHLEILDRYAMNELLDVKKDLEVKYREYSQAKKELDGFTLDEEERNRNISFLQYEIEEIENAAIMENEDEEIETQYRKMVNAQKIAGSVSEVKYLFDSGNEGSISDGISRAYQALNKALQYDESLGELVKQIGELEDIAGVFDRDINEYADGLVYDEASFNKIEKRLDTINTLKAKYGKTIEDINNYKNEAKDRLKFYEDYENSLKNTKQKVNEAYNDAVKLCGRITEIRSKAAKELAGSITEALKDLNFEQVEFDIKISPLKDITKDGCDEAEFLISVNPGEELKPLVQIASGGELSRIMLGIKSVLAAKDDTDTLIFDEIDTGISGRTAQKVSEKMAGISKTHQIICITHLPQIAAMADNHFLIEKDVIDGITTTHINRLSKAEIIDELSRMLGGTMITDIVRENARQMKQLADDLKK